MKKEKKGKHAAQQSAERPKGRGIRNLIIVLTIIGIVALAVRIYVRPPSSDHQLSKPPSNDTSLPSGVTEPQTPVTKPNKNAYTCLLIGHRDGMTDTLMVAMLDLDSKTAGVVSIPRDTMVDVKRRVPKINGAYGSGGGGDEGVDQLLDEMSTILGYRPNNYCLINMNAFVKIVDLLGGVEFDVPVRMYKPSEGIDLKAGVQVLNGNKALQLVRFRTYGKSAAEAGIDHDDYGRMQVQQMFLQAMLEQALTLDNITKVPSIIDTVGKNMRSDMDAGNIGWYAEQVLKIGIDKVSFATLPTYSINYGDSSIAKGYYEVIESEAALEVINRLVNPFTFEITAAMVSHASDPSK